MTRNKLCPKPFLIEKSKFYISNHLVFSRCEVFTAAMMKMKFLLDKVACRFVKIIDVSEEFAA
jgi:hypothetical protein